MLCECIQWMTDILTECNSMALIVPVDTLTQRAVLFNGGQTKQLLNLRQRQIVLSSSTVTLP